MEALAPARAFDGVAPSDQSEIGMRHGGLVSSSNLAVCAHLHGLSCVILDLDAQGTSEAWGDLRPDEGPEVIGAKAGNLAKHLRSAESRDTDLAIIDAPPAETREARLGIKHSELVLIPVTP
jgi:cellulose biosynthesis protein BcsQ